MKNKYLLLLISFSFLFIGCEEGKKAQVIEQKDIKNTIELKKEVDKTYNLKTFDGETIKLTVDNNILISDKLENKLVLINFWATWCPPCKKEIPVFNEIYEKYKDNFIVIGVLYEKDLDMNTLSNFIKENNIKTVIPVSDKPVEIGNMTFKFYQPEKDFGNTNDNSLVTMLEYDEKRFLFTGDISSKREESMVNSDKELKCDVLKVAHHGSKYSSSEDFLAKASPETAVISVSADDTALPDYYITALLNSVCKNVYRTDSDKTVMITVENGEICTKTHA